MRRLIFIVVACTAVAGCMSSSSPPLAFPWAATPAHRAQNLDADFPEPPIVRASNGVAKISLVAQINPALGQPEFVYEGVAGVIPTIAIKPGQTIVVNLSNQLPNVPPPAGPDRESMGDDMNLHFHGLTVSPQRPSDDVLGMLAGPGEHLHYVVHVPANQEPGLYWYHPHVHTMTSFQVGNSGLSGAIVVEGLERHLRGLANLKQRLIIVRATGPGDGDSQPQRDNNGHCETNDGLTVTLNGIAQPVIPIAPGERQFFRVVNATGHKTLKLAVDGEKLELVAIDGFALDTHPGTPPTIKEDSIVLPPAGRAEFIVTGPASGHGKFRTLCYDSGPGGDPDPPSLLATLEAPAPGVRPAALPALPFTVAQPLPQNVYTTSLPPIAAKRTVVLTETARRFLINGKAFHMDARPMYEVHVGTVEQWQIVNRTQEVHDFHIHQVHFLVEKIDGVKVAHPYWADSVVVPHRNGNHPGGMILLMDFRDPVIRGEFVFHCHILDHEDSGMMAKIRAI